MTQIENPAADGTASGAPDGVRDEPNPFRIPRRRRPAQAATAVRLQPSIARFLRENEATLYRIERLGRDRHRIIIDCAGGRRLAVSFFGTPLDWRRSTVIHRLRYAIAEAA